MEQQLKELAFDFFNVDAIKFGEFVTKVGLTTPVYVDLRVLIAHPKIMQKLSRALWELSKNSSSKVTQICGVPYTALPIATIISIESNIPMLIRRKEAKGYGTKKLIEGQFKPGEHCVIIEDIITSGSSILETVNDLQNEGLKVTEALIVVDREQGGRQHLEDHGIKVKSLFTLRKIIEYLVEAEHIDRNILEKVSNYLKNSQAPLKVNNQDTQVERLKMDFVTRARLAKNPLAKKLLFLMDRKQTTLCLAADLTDAEKILELAELAGPHIAVLKIHVDIIVNFTSDFVTRLQELSKKYNFLIMEDRKFGDIGHTVSLQYRNGIYKIAEWADIVTAHSVSGKGVIEGLKHGLNDLTEIRGVFLVAEMSSEGALKNGNYISQTISMTTDISLVSGVVCQSNIFSDPGLIQLTPGVKLSKSGDDLGQRYNTPEDVVNSGADLAVVGRGITEATEKLAAVMEYKKQLWDAYEKRISKE
ncbi:uridine 5'-monophosphate synthase-like [Leptopilina boulardi]|uniref:uridine 5'-monophosphate synthase-like n=1 Tax=Leptopilina boulardi TaxID=63433 RepID=UPI0021F690D6|nr:uridine 5'-monophosphate synthase-like [Leptopilina boulardi]